MEWGMDEQASLCTALGSFTLSHTMKDFAMKDGTLSGNRRASPIWILVAKSIFLLEIFPSQTQLSVIFDVATKITKKCDRLLRQTCCVLICSKAICTPAVRHCSPLGQRHLFLFSTSSFFPRLNVRTCAHSTA
jgi:hypothetical protein